MTVLLGAAVLVWLAGAWLAGVAGSGHVVSAVPVLVADGTPDDQSSPAPKSAAPSQPSSGKDTGSAQSQPPKSSPAPSSGQPNREQSSGTQAEKPAPAPGQKPPATDGNTTGDAAKPAPPPGQTAQPAANDDRAAQLPAPGVSVPDGARSGSEADKPGTPAWVRRYDDPSLGGTAGKSSNRPDTPAPGCQPGAAGCGGSTPAVPGSQAPSGAGAGSGGASGGSGGGQATAASFDGDPLPYLTGQKKIDEQQPGGLVPKNEAPHSGLDPPAGTTTPAPNAVPQKPQPNQPGTGSGQVPPDSTLPGLAPLGTPRAVTASTQTTQAGQALPATAPTAIVPCVPGKGCSGPPQLTPEERKQNREVLSYAPVIGAIASADSAGEAAGDGRWGEAIVEGAGVVPFFKWGKGAIKGAAKALPDLIKKFKGAEKAEDAAGDAAKAATPGAPKPGEPQPADGAKPPPNNPSKPVDQGTDPKASGGGERLPWTSWENYPKETYSGREYARIGDRLYTRHAVDRLQPSGNRYRERGSGIGPPVGPGRVEGRSVSPTFVEDVITSTKGVPVKGPKNEDRLEHESGSVKVWTEENDSIVVSVLTK